MVGSRWVLGVDGVKLDKNCLRRVRKIPIFSESENPDFVQKGYRKVLPPPPILME